MAEYIGSELYNSIKTNTKEQLLNKKRYIEVAITYWVDRNNSEHLIFFNDALAHLNERVSKL